MPLGVRDMLLIVRAKDQASRVLEDVARTFGKISGTAEEAAMRSIAAGGAILGVGIGLTAIGGEMVALLDDAVGAAREYSNQSALTLTQVDQLGVSLEDIKRIGREVAAEIPAPFEQMQAALYDIFSSMDVNVQQAQGLLTGFARAAVAGQTDVQTAGRATIAIMNGFKIPVEQVNKVLDIQFEAVRKGVFTYEEFATAIGRAIPSANRAGQSIETLASMMAFLTRNGLSADQAATSTARAFDLLSNPKFQKRMQEFGIAVFDAAGNFRPMLDVVTELRGRLSQMTPEEQTAKLAELTQGAGGVIQAMRFLNLAVNDTNGMFGSLSSSISGASGSLDTAYDIMFDQPASQAQLLSNNLEILKTMVGDVLLPTVNTIVEAFVSFFQAVNDINPELLKWLVRGFALVAVLTTLFGIILSVVGAVMVINGVLTLVGLTFGGIIAMAASLVLAFITFIAVVAVFVGSLYLIWKGFEDGNPLMITAGLALLALISPTLAFIAALALLGYAIYDNWDTIVGWAETALEYVMEFFGWVSETAVGMWSDAWNAVTDTIETAAGKIVDWAQFIWGKFLVVFQWFQDVFGEGIRKVFGAVSAFVSKVLSELAETAAAVFSQFQWWLSGTVSVAEYVWPTIQALIEDFINFLMSFIDIAVSLFYVLADVFGMLMTTAVMVFDGMVIYFQMVFDIIITIIGGFVEAVIAFWDQFGSIITAITKNFWDFIVNVVTTAINLIRDIISVVLNLIQGDWTEAWDSIKQFFIDAWNGIWGALTGVWDLMVIFFTDMPGAIVGFLGDLTGLLTSKGWAIMNSLWDGIKETFINIVGWFMEMPGRIIQALGDLSRLLFDIGKTIIRGLIDGIKDMFGSVKDTLVDLKDKILDWKGPKAADLKLLHPAGIWIMEGLTAGLMAGWDDVQDYLGSLDPATAMNIDGSLTGFGRDLGRSAAPVVIAQGNGGVTIAEGAITIHDARDPDATAIAVRTQLEELINEMASR
jgi:TP901 family phage tail tape measure protein